VGLINQRLLSIVGVFKCITARFYEDLFDANDLSVLSLLITKGSHSDGQPLWSHTDIRKQV
jgi:hypothetical protein